MLSAALFIRRAACGISLFRSIRHARRAEMGVAISGQEVYYENRNGL